MSLFQYRKFDMRATHFKDINNFLFLPEEGVIWSEDKMQHQQGWYPVQQLATSVELKL